MARRRKQQSILELAIAGSWKVSATLAVLLSLIIFVVLPSLTNPILKPIALGFRPIGLIVVIVFTVISIVKYLRQKKSDNKNSYIEHFKPTTITTYPAYPESPQDASKSPPLEPPTVWSLKLIQEIEWKRFEELAAAYYNEKGILAVATSLGADGGIDINLYQDDSGKPTSIVQCKAWNSRQVGVKEIREFLGVMTHQQIAKGFYMTSGEYSIDAKETAAANKITLINGEMLLAMIKRLPEKSQQKLLKLATFGDYTTPSCSACGVKMVVRTSKQGEFWGCVNYPRCRQMMHLKNSN